MNINKWILIFVVLMTFLLSLTCVSAADFNNVSVTDLSGFNDDNIVGEFSTHK